jgi:hypothetical protein
LKKFQQLLLFFFSGAIWTSWSPISAAAKAVFPTWTDGTLAMFTNWGSITYLILIVPTCWAIESHLRKSMLWCVTLMAIGAGLRCIPLQLDADNIVLFILILMCFNMNYLIVFKTG